MVERITKEEVEKVAKLARLGMKEEELDKATDDLQGVLENFSQIQEIDTKGVPTSDDVTGMNNVMREDKAIPERLATHEQLLKNAPATKDGQLKVKSVF